MTNPNLLEVGRRIHEIQQLKKVHERNALIMLLLLLLFVCLFRYVFIVARISTKNHVQSG